VDVHVCRPFEKACVTSSFDEPILTPASLWPETTLGGQHFANHTVASSSGPDPAERAASSRTIRGARTRLPINRIDPDARNPRPPTSQELDDLVRSISTHGLLQPIVVRPVGSRYMVVAGHRRFAAWVRCASAAPSDPHWRAIDAMVRDVDAQEALTLMLVENVQRKSLSPLQEALALQRLRVDRGWTNRQVAEAIQKSEMYVSRRIRVLDDTILRDAVLRGSLAVTTAEELLAADVSVRSALVARAIEEGWSPDDARRAARAVGSRSRTDSLEERWHSQLTALKRLLDQQALPPATLQAEITRIAHRLLA
jgi:ParB family chromosome partitioning protein